MGTLRRHAVLTGDPIRVSVRPDLRCSGGRIVGRSGTPVHAATFIRRRAIVLDADLLGDDDELRRILIHELFSFCVGAISEQHTFVFRVSSG